MEPLMGRVNPPVEAKVRAASVGATAGAGIGTALAAFLVWMLDSYVFEPAVSNSVPWPVQGLVWALVPLLLAGGAAYRAGYQAKHTPRPDLAPVRSAKRRIEHVVEE
jgi:hypothetical protein